METATVLKPCGCKAYDLTRNRTIWVCAGCGHAQGARGRRCGECKRAKPPAPMGFGCCDETWHAHVACGTCGRGPCADEPVRCSDLHPELVHLTPSVDRGSFQDRRGATRCVGCHREE